MEKVNKSESYKKEIIKRLTFIKSEKELKQIYTFIKYIKGA